MCCRCYLILFHFFFLFGSASYFIFHILSFTSLRKWAKCLHMRTRESIHEYMHAQTNKSKHIHTRFFSHLHPSIYMARHFCSFRPIYQYVCMCVTVSCWNEFVAEFTWNTHAHTTKWQHKSSKWTEKKIKYTTISRNGFKNLTYFGHGSYQNNSISTS